MDEEEEKKDGLGDKALQAGKQTAKQAVKSQIKKILIPLLPYIIAFFLGLLILGAILLAVNTVISAIKSFLGFGDGDSTTIGQDVKAAISLSEDGFSYVINEDFIDNIIKSLEAGALNPMQMGLTYSEKDSVDENGNIKENMLRRYVISEVRTMFPKIGTIGLETIIGLDGIIKIKRDDGQDGTSVKNLIYVPYNTFKAIVDSGKERAQNYFSINPENFNLCYATANVLEEYDYNDQQISRTVTLTMSEVEIQHLVEPYAMPINFLISTHFIAQDENFMSDLLELQSITDGIDITLKDTVNTTTITVDYSGKVYEKIDESAKYTDTATSSSDTVSVNKDKEHDIDNSNIGSYYDGALTAKTVYINRSTELMVTKADTWISNVENTYTKSISGDVNQDTQINNIKIPENAGEYTEEINESLKFTTYNVVNQDTNSIDVDRLVNLLKQDKYARVKNNIITASDFYFKLLNQDEKSQDIEQIMRYVLFKLTGNDIYGVNDESFEEFSSGLFTRVSTIYGDNFEEKVWFALIGEGYSPIAVAGAMGNFMQESGFRSNNLQNSYEARLGSDNEYTTKVNNGTYTKQQFVNDSAGYGLAQWTFSSRKEGLYDYAKEKGASIDDENMQIEYLIKEIKQYGCTKWQGASNVEDATIFFQQEFEKAGEPAYNNRIRFANDIYNKYKNMEKPSNTGSGNFPRYYQSGQPWSSNPYNYKSGGTISSGGCGACALAMAVSGLTGNNITPDVIVQYLNSINTNTVNDGAKSAQMVANKYGLSYEFVNRSDKTSIDRALDSGKVCIFSIKANGIYRGGGHFIMCSGRDDKGYYVLESGRFYETGRPYLFNQVFSPGNQGVFILGK